ncbi:cupin domain-containing protein [Sphingopyxis kveilinensis]|uniref:cupin domain-containing protein n=1 Tax=Sphingopyxis kveilinensis TaxID=3114367 RepID=UPI0030CE5C74
MFMLDRETICGDRSHVVPFSSSISNVQGLHSPAILGCYRGGNSHAHVGVIRITNESAADMWERHDDGDELLFIVEGRMIMTVREQGGEVALEAGAGDLLFIARGAGHTAQVLSDEVRLAFLSPVRGTTVWNERHRSPAAT